jgi:RNA polymerase sigma factor for flagellar operon FliA
MTAMVTESESQSNGSGDRVLDRDAYNRFLPMVRRTAMYLARRVPRHITVDDLVGYGWVGVAEAHRRADPAMAPGEFEAYASYRIRGAMLDYLRSLDPATRELRRSSRKVTETIRELSGRLGRAPEEEEIAAALDLSLEDYGVLLQRMATGGMARLELLDLENLPVEGTQLPADEDIGRKELGAAVTIAIDQLPPRLRQILALYYQEDCTLREIGTILGVTESRISQLHTEAMHRLRAIIGRQ